MPIKVTPLDQWSLTNSSSTISYGVKTDGSLWAWGQTGLEYNLLAQEQIDEIKVISSKKILSPFFDKNVKSISCSKVGLDQSNYDNHTLLVKDDGTMWSWGQNISGELGQSDRGTGKPYPTKIGQQSWISVSAGNDISAAIKSDRTLWTWGYNFYGQLGHGNRTSRSSPVQVGTFPYKNVYATTARVFSTSNMLAIRNDGFLWVWGNNTNGQLGQGNTTNRSSPVQVDSNLGVIWSSVSGSADHSLSLKSDGSLWTWGNNYYGQLGLGDFIHRSSPVQVGTSSWTSVSSGSQHSLAIKPDGSLWAWGSNYTAQLGLPNIFYGPFYINGTNYTLSPVAVTTTTINPRANSWTFISAKNRSSYGILYDGSLWAWGDNNSGELGLGSNYYEYGSEIRFPNKIGNSSWVFVSAGGYEAAAIRSDGSLWAWGSNDYGQLGQGDLIDRSSPVQVGSQTNWSKVYGGPYYDSFMLAIKTDGSLWAWGNNFYGQLGQGDLDLKSSPVQIGTSSWVSIATGYELTPVLGIKADGSLWAWGRNDYGQLGQNKPNVIGCSSPVQIGTSSWTFISGRGDENAYGIKSNGSLWVSGNNYRGQLGLSSLDSKLSFIQLGNLSWTFVSSSYLHTAAIRSDGTLWAWGRNNYGQLGQGDLISRSSPVQIGTSSWSFVSLNEQSSFAIRSDGTLWAWGYNYNGALGQGDRITRSSPVQIGTSSWTMISSGYSSLGNANVGIKADGTLWAWGWNNNGQLGQNDRIHRSSPVQIGTSSWTAVSVGTYFTAAIRSDGSLWAWGLNTSGQLGQSDLVHRSSPVQIGTSSWSSVNAGVTYVTAIRSDGTLWAWGLNYGQLGQGDFIHRSSPVQIGTSSWTAVSGNIAKKLDGTLWAWGEVRYYFPKLSNVEFTWNPSPVQIGTSSWSIVTTWGPSVAAIKTDGTLWAWGGNISGELGQGDYTLYSSPVQVGTSSWSSVSLGVYGYALAIKPDKTLWAWGGNSSGQLGQGNRTDILSPVQIGTSSWSIISTGSHAMAVKSDGTLWTWGPNFEGQLGVFYGVNSPNQVGTSSWSTVSGSGGHTLGIKSDGTLWAWGQNFWGQLGQGDKVHKSSPVQIGTSSWSSVSAGYNYSLALKPDKSLWAWGWNINGQLGQNDVINRSSPVQVGTSSWSSVFAGAYSSLGIKLDGTLMVWGFNQYGALGQSDNIDRSSPVQVGTSSWTAVSAPRLNYYGVHAIKLDGTLWSWGGNFLGGSLLGLGDNISRSSPVQVGQSNNYFLWNNISSGKAIRSDGTLWTWGNNYYGQLGQNDTIHRSSPVQVGSEIPNVWEIGSMQDGTVLVTKKNGSLWAWGNNNSGQLGLNDRNHRSSPVQVGTSSWTFVEVGPRYAFAIKSNGTLWSWGINTHGQLGLNDRIHRSSPVQVGTYSWTSVSAGDSHVTAIRSDKTLWVWGRNNYNQLGLGDNYSRSTPVQVTPETYNIINSTNAFSSGQSSGGIIRYSGDGLDLIQIGSDNIIDLNKGMNFVKNITETNYVNFELKNFNKNTSFTSGFSLIINRSLSVTNIINFNFDIKWANNIKPVFNKSTSYDRISFTIIGGIIYGEIEYASEEFRNAYRNR